MGSLNKAVLIGYLWADPEFRSFQNGGKVASLQIVTSEQWKSRDTGEREERTEWHAVSIFAEDIVNVAERSLRKGSRVYIEGQVQTRKWRDHHGNDRYSTEVVVRRFRGKLMLLSPAKAVSITEPKETGAGERHPSTDAPPPKRSPPPKPPLGKATETKHPKLGRTHTQSQNPDPEWRPSDKLCVACGEPITVGRIKALPDTVVCIDCASSRPTQPRRFDEPLGSRDDFKKDSGNNFGSAGKNRNF